eukprot:6176465-Pleurochrysis_carterae.AAC.1
MPRSHKFRGGRRWMGRWRLLAQMSGGRNGGSAQVSKRFSSAVSRLECSQFVLCARAGAGAARAWISAAFFSIAAAAALAATAAPGV